MVIPTQKPIQMARCKRFGGCIVAYLSYGIR
ncbi:MAG: hypothetical protein QOF93_443 [Verrucomicrobiota bacterium]